MGNKTRMTAEHFNQVKFKYEFKYIFGPNFNVIFELQSGWYPVH